MKQLLTIIIFSFSLFISNTLGQWQKNIIDNSLDKPEVVAIGDLNGDAKPDIIVNDLSDDKFLLYENNYPTWTKYILDSNLDGAYVSDIGDLDGDGDLDVAASGYHGNVVVWYENNFPEWEKHIIDANLTVSGAVSIADIDGDDTLDIVSSGYRNGGDVVWYENNLPDTIWVKHTIRSNYPTEWSWVGDIDGDDAIDVAVCRWYEDEVVWFMNENAGQTWSEFTIDDNLDGASHLYISDMDGDDDIDIAAAGAHDGDVVWYENNLPEWEKHIIDANLNGAWTVVVVDVDGDEKQDVAAVSKDADVIVWYENNHPEWKKKIIDANLDGPILLLSGDINNDNAFDIVVPGMNAGNLVWYKNPYNSQMVEASFEFEGLTRDYIVYLPVNYEPNMPLVINLHGSWPDDALWLMNYTGMNEIADTAGFISVYPYSIEPRWHANSGIPNIAEPDVNDVGFISALMDTLIVNYKVDTSHIYCSGLNYGGWMASELICQIGNRFAAGARVNTSLGINQAARSTLNGSFPMVLFNGTADTYLPWPDGKEGVMGGEEAINWWVDNNGCSPFYNAVSLPDIDPNDGCSVEKISYKNSSDETLVVFYKVIGGGLSWPGSTWIEGWDTPVNKDINAGVEIWNFFKDFTRPEENTPTEIWTQRADMNIARKSHSSCELDGKIYVIGGKGSTVTLNSVEVYDPDLDSWTQKADMSSGRVGFSTCEFNGKILAIGGSQSMNANPIISIEEYDPYLNTWSHKTNMPRARIGHTASVVNDNIYIIGGSDASYTNLSEEVDVYDLITGEWTMVASLPTPRMGLSSAVINGKIFTMGGTFGSSGGYLGLDIVEVYNPVTDKWSNATKMIIKRKNFAACELDGSIYVFGGSNLDCGGILSSTESYDPATDTWEEKSSIPSILGGPSAVQLNGKIYISGGSTTACPATPQSSMYEYAIIPTSIKQEAKKLVIPKNFVLNQNYPNPFNPSTIIKYEIPDLARNDNILVQLKVYDILGREVATLVNKQQKAGYYEVKYNASNLTSGIYFYRIKAGNFINTKKMVLLR